MIYFLVNNNYHLDFDFKLIESLNSADLALIQVPFSLDIKKGVNRFSKVYHFSNTVSLSVVKPLNFSKVRKSIKNQLILSKTDILFVHTDIVLLNQYIIQRFLDVEAKVYLVEDGTATMCTYNIKSEKASLKEQFKAFILRNLYGLNYLNVAKFGVETLFGMDDKVFKGLLVNYGKETLRNIPVYNLRREMEVFEIKYPNGGIFFNQGLYIWFCTELEYVAFLKAILKISYNFHPFYFKFHPSDTNSIILEITKLIKENFQNVIIISDDENAESIINKYPVKYAITFNSTSALNLITKGIKPIFLNNFFNSQFPDKSLDEFNKFVYSVGLKLPNSLQEVNANFEPMSDSFYNDKISCTFTQILSHD
jgi:hypothetical protein